MSSSPEDIQILDLFKKGGPQAEKAFRLLVNVYGERLYVQIRRMVNSHELTNDVLQNVLIKIYQNLGKFNRDSALYTWIYRIARNETLNFLEKEKRRSGVDIEPQTLEVIAGHSVLDSTTPERITQLLHAAIDQLPEKQAMVFQLKYFDELKYSEISKQLDTSEGALKASFHIAKQKIQEFILSQLNL